MRPEVLYDLFAPTTSLSGVGPRIAKLIEILAGTRLVDILWHLPSGLIDRSNTPHIADAQIGTIVTLIVDVDKHVPPRIRRLPYKVTCSDKTGSIVLVFFHAREAYLKRLLPEGETRVVTGKVEEFGGKLQISHPDQVGTLNELSEIQSVQPVYPLTQGLSRRILSKAIRKAIDIIPELPEWQDSHYINLNDWPSWKDAVTAAHTPQNDADLKPLSEARQRLAYDELLANQLALTLARNRMRRTSGRSLPNSPVLRAKIEKSLPFRLTGSQSAAITEIANDMALDLRMHRLLQGDVGSGKTVVALLGMATAIEAGYQTALLAPTEILARQHFITIEPIAKAVGIKVGVYTGSDKGKVREQILERLSTGDIQLAIGTHSLFQEDVEFKNLAMAVIDEQHRFGVHQRLSFTEKGESVDLLVMTATPIPRTLSLTAYGDMEISQLTDKPANRLPIDTRTVAANRLEEVYTAVGRALSANTKVYWICPLIDESATLDLAAATERCANLKSLFGDRVGLLHGRMKGEEKDFIMKAFSDHEVDILVSTTVVEVGIDVPKATIMIIEQAEKFGLAQLHQLRGRIGRGSEKSTCLLVYNRKLTSTARQRLEILRETEDGFFIAEEDLRLRGAGDVLGTRQSGLPEMKLVDFKEHEHLFQPAHDYAKLILEKDPTLSTDWGQKLRLLLYLFEKDTGVKFLRKA